MRVTDKIGRRAVRLTNGTLNMTVLAAVLLFLVFGCYALWDSNLVYGAADAAHYAMYKPTAENEGLSFRELQAINPEVRYWLTVYGTHIDYPVVQGADNLKYINTDAKGDYALTGAVFLDYKNRPDFTDFNSILFGHHMEKQAMFGEIGRFAEQSYFNARRYGSLYCGGREHGLEFFAFVHADAYDETVFNPGVTGKEAQQAYLDMLAKKAIHLRRDVPVTTDDRIVLLSTCSASSTNGRDILIGKITDKPAADPFRTDTAKKPNAVPVIGRLPDLWAQTLLWVRIMIVILPFLVILPLIILIVTKKKRSDTRRRRR